MKIYNVCFSPTGGTKKVADTLISHFEEEPCFVNLLAEKEEYPTFEKGDLSFISVPSYAGRVPELATMRISKLKGNESRAVLSVAFGNRAIDDTLVELYDIATKAGFHVVAALEAVTEHSLARMYGKNRPDEEDRKELGIFAKKIREKLERGTETVLELPGKRPYKTYKSFPTVTSVDKEACIHCGRCAMECPSHAISPENVAKVEMNLCFSCMHCVSVCPVGARTMDKEAMARFEEHLKACCAERKKNRLYI